MVDVKFAPVGDDRVALVDENQEPPTYTVFFRRGPELVRLETFEKISVDDLEALARVVDSYVQRAY